MASRIWVLKQLELRIDACDPPLRDQQARLDAAEAWYGKEYAQAREELLESSRNLEIWMHHRDNRKESRVVVREWVAEGMILKQENGDDESTGNGTQDEM